VAVRLPVCGYTLDRLTCKKRGDHFCEPRARHVVAFMEELLLHTKGRYARKPFLLAGWQRDDIVRPMFGETRWSPEYSEYVRRYRVAWIEIARKNGKSELLAAIMLYLLVGDGEESAELYAVARDRDQAALVFNVAARMVTLSPILAARLTVKEYNRRIVDERTGSVYEVIAADAKGALGSNPSGVGADEILAWRDRSMWDAQRSGMGSGARAQPLMVAATTAGNDPNGFAAGMHAEMVRVLEDPQRSPHVFAFVRNTPQDADPWDEVNWPHANPALGDFLSWEAMRQEALEAQNDPAAENSFRQFRLNQWVAQSSRWMPMHLYRAAAGDVWPTPTWHRDMFRGRTAYGGFDLSAISDLTAWCLVFPDGAGGADVTWRFWVPEVKVPSLDVVTNGAFSRWVHEGWVTTSEGNRVDHDVDVYPQIESDARDFNVAGADGDEWSMYRVVQEIGQRTGVEVATYSNTYKRMTPGGDELMALVKEESFRHHGNPVAEWCFDNVEIFRAKFDANLYRLNKPDRGAPGARVDAVPAAVMAINAWKLAEATPVEKPRSRRVVAFN